MIARWKFFAVTTQHAGPPISVRLALPEGGRIFRGTAAEALFLSHKIRPAACDHLIIATHGRPLEIPNEIDWAVSILTPRAGKNGWDLTENEVVHHAPLRTVIDATHYALFRSTGKLAAVRVESAEGVLRQLVLCDMRVAGTEI